MGVLLSMNWMKDDIMSSMKLLALRQLSASGDILIGRVLARLESVTIAGAEM